jgi:hypothetical protein
LLFRYRVAIWMALRSAWAALRNFIASLFSWFRPATKSPKWAPTAGGVRPFKDFKNPFVTGAAGIWPPEKLIVYSYDALQSRAMEHEATRRSPQTPREFCRRLGEEIPELAEALESMAFYYGHVAYGATVPANYNPEHLRRLWEYISSGQSFHARHTEQVASG